MVFGIGAELGEQDVFLRSRWDFDPAFLPERIEVRHQVALRALAEGAVDVAQPKGLVPPLGEALLAAELPRQIEENVKVVARVADGFDRLVHRDDEPIARRAAQIVALERDRRRQHDVGTARGRRPPRLVDNDCSGRRQARRSRFRS